MSLLETQDLIKQFKQYDTVVTAVDRVNFSVESGEFAAVIGASGSGKSTMLRILAGLEPPTAGKVTILGESIHDMKPDELSHFRGQHLGFVFQNHNLIAGLTALENILVPTIMCNKISIRYEEHLKKLIRALDLGDRLHHLPNELSGGQQQRVAIARALINRPQILFADEPTGNLDNETAQEVLKVLLSVREMVGQALIVVTHDMHIAEQADTVYRMTAGQLERVR
jgi:putative ABC transport system ATP-binding protein